MAPLRLVTIIQLLSYHFTIIKPLRHFIVFPLELLRLLRLLKLVLEVLKLNLILLKHYQMSFLIIILSLKL